MTVVKLAGLELFVDTLGELRINDADGNEIGRTTVADALTRAEALHALLRYAAIGDGGF